MAIRFVDKAPDDGGAKPKAARREPGPERAEPQAAPSGLGTPQPDAVSAAEPELPVLAPPAGPGPAEGEASALPYAKPEPKPRGRKKPLSAAGGATPKPADAEAGPRPGEPAADGLLPGLQVHAKPEPKPRGRKKAFG